jgi:hypothetical protein
MNVTKTMTRALASDSGLSENDPGTGPATSASPAHSANDDEQPIDEGDGAEIEIENIFKRKIAGARLLPRCERAQARREARDWRRLALKALREKRLNARHARYMQRLWKRMRPPSCDRG